MTATMTIRASSGWVHESRYGVPLRGPGKKRGCHGCLVLGQGLFQTKGCGAKSGQSRGAYRGGYRSTEGAVRCEAGWRLSFPWCQWVKKATLFLSLHDFLEGANRVRIRISLICTFSLLPLFISVFSCARKSANRVQVGCKVGFMICAYLYIVSSLLMVLRIREVYCYVLFTVISWKIR